MLAGAQVVSDSVEKHENQHIRMAFESYSGKVHSELLNEHFRDTHLP